MASKSTRQRGEAVRRDGNSVGEIAVGSPVERGQFDWRAGGLHDLHSLRNDFFSDAVAGDHGNTLGQLTLATLAQP